MLDTFKDQEGAQCGQSTVSERGKVVITSERWPDYPIRRAALHRVQSQPPSPTGWKHCVAQAPSPQNDTWGFCSSLSKSNSEVVATWSMATAVAEGKKARQIRHWLLKVPPGRDIHHFHRHVSHRTHTIWRGQESVILSVLERRTGSAEKKLRTLPSGQWGWGGVTSRQIS